MNKIYFILTMLCLACSDNDIPETPATPPKTSLKKQWETGAVFKIPESVLYDAENNLLYVSNINGEPDGKDGNGFISQLDLSGNVKTLEWLKGFNAPKGMAIYHNKLYVADIDKVKVVDLTTEEIVQTITVPTAIFLNDVAIDANGLVYVSDTGSNAIYQISADGTASLWITNLNGPNGLLARDSKLYLVEFGSGNFYQINTESKSKELLSSGFTQADGIVHLGEDGWLISNFGGEVNLVSNNTKSLLLDTRSSGANAADLGYVTDEKLVLVPTFANNTVAAYTVEK